MATYTQQYLPGFAPCEAADKRRIKKLTIAMNTFIFLLGKHKDGTRRLKMLGIPPDAQVVDWGCNPSYPKELIVYISSCSFDIVDEGALIPDIDPIISVIVDYIQVPNSEYYYAVHSPSKVGNNDPDKRDSS